MDWIIIAAILITAWAMLSVVSGERISQAQRLTILLTAAAEQAKASSGDVPVAKASEAGNRKR